MTAHTMSMGWQQRRSNSTAARLPIERLVVLGLLTTLALSAVLVISDSMRPELTTLPAAQITETIDTGAVVVAAAEPSFVESAAPTAGPVAVSTTLPLVGFEAFTQEPGLYQVAGDSAINIRVMPGVDADAIGQIAPGDETLTFATGEAATDGTETWMQVDHAGVSGWVRSDLMNPADAN